MLLNFTNLLFKYKAKPNGVIAVGAHYGEEYDDYVKNGIKRIVFIEPCKNAFDILMNKFDGNNDVLLLNVACGDSVQDRVWMNTCTYSVNHGQSNSLLKPALHLSLHPEIEFNSCEEVNVTLLDNLGLSNKGYDLLVMDVQGYEGYVVKGAINTLKQINWIYAEVNQKEVYEKNTMVEELDSLLHEFIRVETGQWVGGAWSDAFYVRKSLLHD